MQHPARTFNHQPKEDAIKHCTQACPRAGVASVYPHLKCFNKSGKIFSLGPVLSHKFSSESIKREPFAAAGSSKASEVPTGSSPTAHLHKQYPALSGAWHYTRLHAGGRLASSELPVSLCYSDVYCCAAETRLTYKDNRNTMQTQLTSRSKIQPHTTCLQGEEHDMCRSRQLSAFTGSLHVPLPPPPLHVIMFQGAAEM